MKATKIPEQEQKFSEQLTNTSRVKYKDEGKIEIGDSTIRQIRPNFDSYYYKSETEKDAIVIHSTAGTLRADMASLSKKDNHVSVSYVIARSGEIYELFDPKYWAYHLGNGAVGGNKNNSKRTIAIELSNYGPLTKRGENLETIYSQLEYTDTDGNKKKSKKDVYCTLDEVGEYTIVEDGFRGYEYFASFTTEQYAALSDLLDYLCNEFDIPREFIDEDDRFEVFKSATDAKSFKGICTHVNFRKTGKWDLGPDFDWNRLITKEIELEEVEIRPEDLMNPPEPEPEVIPDVPVKEEPQAPRKSNMFGFVFGLIAKLFGK